MACGGSRLRRPGGGCVDHAGAVRARPADLHYVGTPVRDGYTVGVAPATDAGQLCRFGRRGVRSSAGGDDVDDGGDPAWAAELFGACRVCVRTAAFSRPGRIVLGVSGDPDGAG